MRVSRSVGLTAQQWVDPWCVGNHPASMKTAGSISDKNFRSADSLVRRLGMSRSQLYATALADFLSRRGSQQGKERLDAIYGGGGSRLGLKLNQVQIKSFPPRERGGGGARR